ARARGPRALHRMESGSPPRGALPRRLRHERRGHDDHALTAPGRARATRTRARRAGSSTPRPRRRRGASRSTGRARGSRGPPARTAPRRRGRGRPWTPRGRPSRTARRAGGRGRSRGRSDGRRHGTSPWRRCSTARDLKPRPQVPIRRGMATTFPPVASAGKARAIRNLHVLHDVLESSAMAGRTWVFGGMLLGWAREGDLLGHDCDDFDFAYHSDDAPRFECIFAGLAEAGFQLIHRFPGRTGTATEYAF